MAHRDKNTVGSRLQFSLYKAFQQIDVSAVVACLTSASVSPADIGKVLNTVAHDGSLPLIKAVETASVEVVQAVLDAGADPSMVDSNKDTALSAACRAGHHAIVRLLAAQLGVGMPEATHAALGGMLRVGKGVPQSMVSLLLDLSTAHRDLKGNTDILVAAVESGNVSLFELVLNHLYPRDTSSPSRTTVTEIDAGVLAAAYERKWRHDSDEMMAYFLSGGGVLNGDSNSDCDADSDFGCDGCRVFRVQNHECLAETVYHATRFSDEEVLRYFIALGFDCKRDPHNPVPILYEAINVEWVEGVQLLIDVGGAAVDELVYFTDAESLLGIAVLNFVRAGRAGSDRSFQIAEILLKAGADPNVHLVSMPLHTAVCCNHWLLVELLLNFGADPLVKNYEGESAVALLERGTTDARIVNEILGASC